MIATADCLSPNSSLSREQLIDQIQNINPTAASIFLAGFDRDQLLAYLEHLAVTLEPRGPAARWERPAGTPAISRWVPSD